MFFQTINYKNKINKENGFTLVEILVVTAIIIVLSAVVIPHYKAGNQHFRVQRSAHQLSQSLRHVQEMAMGAKEIGIGIVNPGHEFYPDGGFGIHFDINEPDHYIIFADCDGNGQLSSSSVACVSSSEPSPKHKFPELMEQVYFESKVEMGSLISVNLGIPVDVSTLQIVFRAPYPSILISDGTEAEINLQLEMDHANTQTIIINEAGLIYVE